jgi:hypothetical protein
MLLLVLLVLLVPCLLAATPTTYTMPEGLVFTRFNWQAVKSSEPHEYHYSLVCTIANRSKETSYSTVRAEFSVLYRASNYKFRNYSAQQVNMQPGDSWAFTICTLHVPDNVNFSKTYYARVDRVTGTQD